MPELYQRNPYLKSAETAVLAVSTVRKMPALCLADNILYPGGGGQPADTGRVTLGPGRAIQVSRVLKINAAIYAVLAETANVSVGESVTVEVDWENRYRNMRYHTAAHVLMGVIRRAVTGYAASSIEIAADGSRCDLRFEGSWSASPSAAAQFVADANALIAKGRRVSIEECQALPEAVARYADLYRGPDAMKGPVSIVVIDGWDANPCGGTHLADISEAGGVALLDQGSGRVTFALTS